MPEVCTKGWEVFQRCERGAIALVLGLVVLPLIVAAGMAVDYSAAVDAKAKLQTAVDSAALAAANPKTATLEERKAIAE